MLPLTQPNDSILCIQSIQQLLVKRGERLILVESCTAGMVAGLFGQIPGISEVLCGSLVVYRTASKAAWLGIDPVVLDDPALGPVSAVVTCQLALAALEKTPEATIAAAITGHLGPNAPEGMDGLVYTHILRRGTVGKGLPTAHRLKSPAPANGQDVEGRSRRQCEAVYLLLEEIRTFLG
jgi:nicotinamide-nucleotide amidase